MTRKICVVTGSRAEYGLLRWIMNDVRDDLDLVLQIIVTGSHLSENFGSTYTEIEAHGFKIDKKIEILNEDDTSLGVSKSMSLALIGFGEAFAELRPDVIVLLGDRFEIFCAAAAALIARVPVAHLHGGEVTVGAFDDALRHSITKMSHLHFVAADDYRKRVIQLGENPENVYLVGGLGVDSIKKISYLGKTELEKSLNLKLSKKSLLITFHPVTLEDSTSESQMTELLKALSKLIDTTLIFTMPNADTGSRSLMAIVTDFVNTHENSYVFNSLGQLLYLSCVSHVDGVVGNSSSGIAEVPSFNKGTINIGDRQKGRLQASSIINCEPNAESISEAISRLYSFDFQQKLPNVVNPYGEGGASSRILKVLREIPLEGLTKKTFRDI